MESLNDTAPIIEEMDEDSFIVQTSEMKGGDHSMKNSNILSQAPEGSNGLMLRPLKRSVSAIKKGPDAEKSISMRKSPFYQKQRSKANQRPSSIIRSASKVSVYSNQKSDNDE